MVESCLSCTHSCESMISKYIDLKIVDVSLENDVPFPRLLRIEKERYIPVRATDKKSRMIAKEAVNEAIRLIKLSMEHVFDVKMYKLNKPRWSIPKNIILHQNVTRAEIDFGTALVIKSPIMGQSEVLNSEVTFANLRKDSLECTLVDQQLTHQRLTHFLKFLKNFEKTKHYLFKN